MTTEPTISCKATIKAATLAAVCADALLFASTDKSRPVLTSAQLTVKAGRGQVVATDSYVLGSFAFDAEGDFFALIDRDDVKRITALAKAAAKTGQASFITLERDGDTLTIRDDSTALTMRTVPWDFPNWEQLMGRPDDAAQSSHVAFTTRTLGAIAAVRLGAGSRVPLTLRFESAALKPSHVVAWANGIDFRALVMPVKVAEPGSSQCMRAPIADDFAHVEIVKP